MGSFVGKGNRYIQLAKVLYCKMLTISNYHFSHIRSGFDPPTSEVGCVLLLGAKYRSARSRDGTCAISSSKDRAPISRLLKQSRDGAALTHNDFLFYI